MYSKIKKTYVKVVTWSKNLNRMEWKLIPGAFIQR